MTRVMTDHGCRFEPGDLIIDVGGKVTSILLVVAKEEDDHLEPPVQWLAGRAFVEVTGLFYEISFVKDEYDYSQQLVVVAVPRDVPTQRPEVA